MKRPLDEATELFRENEIRAGADREKANFYRGLSLLANGLAPAEIPSSALQDVLSILMATNRTVSPSQFVDACRAARDRDSLERFV